MTIAACYLSPEGVIFGADSTTTFPNPQGAGRHYNYAQKIFQVGDEGSTLAVVMWGMAGQGTLSYRTLIAQFAENNRHQPTNTLLDVASRFGQFFWNEYTTRQAQQIQRFQQLAVQPQLTPDEQKERDMLLQALSGGFCLGGNLFHDRTPQAFEITYNPVLPAPGIQPLSMDQLRFWGVPNLIMRLFLGIDPELFTTILQSGHWMGTPADLSNLINPKRLSPPGSLPLREAIDWVHASVYSTIKALKFSQLSPVCGGPVEIVVISTDRPFRWVCHKKLDAAVTHDGPLNA
jgi:hypothetical protein